MLLRSEPEVSTGVRGSGHRLRAAEPCSTMPVTAIGSEEDDLALQSPTRSLPAVAPHGTQTVEPGATGNLGYARRFREGFRIRSHPARCLSFIVR